MSAKALFKNRIIIPLITLWFAMIDPGYCQSGCTAKACHQGIEKIVPQKYEMMQLIQQTGFKHGDADGCVICHGGNPKTSKKKKAHKSIPSSLKRAAGPKDFYPDPGSIWIVQNTCGVCHPAHRFSSQISLMNTEAGKIQGNLSTWGAAEPDQGYRVKWGNYSVKDRDGTIPVGQAKAYETYMAQLRSDFPDLFPDQLIQLKQPTMDEIKINPALAAFTYQRQECQRCHIGVKGIQRPGDFRGMGCSACHMPYGKDGRYKGNDISIDKNEPGHIRSHTLIGNRKTNGIPAQTCASCHNRGKRIGVSFQGLMESPFKGMFNDHGNIKQKMHGKHYIGLNEDIHHLSEAKGVDQEKKGMLCQDCHTSGDVHGDGNIQGTTLAKVEIECTDCHGTPDKYPWELPLGYGDEFGRDLTQSPPRGVTTKRLLSDQQFGFKYPLEEGLLLTARGNPFGNVTRKKNAALLHSASGHDLKVPLLKQIHDSGTWNQPEAQIAMSAISRHLEKMECYTCHAGWAPQCYGCHVKVDYQKESLDWISSASKVDKQGQTAESRPFAKGIKSAGKAQEQSSFSRWEDPIIGMNGEGRLSPVIPGCQVTYTIVDNTGKTIATNHMATNPLEAESIGQNHIPLAIDMAPVQPHTTQKKARSCESCHLSKKTAGLGSDHLIGFDWTTVSDEGGRQLVTVGSHWPLSRALNKKEMDTLVRTGTCMACHANMTDKEFWDKVSSDEILDTTSHQKMINLRLRKSNPNVK
jgi:hypothetical protein